MYRQKGSALVFGEDGLLKSGLLVRMLVLPNGVGGIAESLSWIAETLSPRVAISLMAQYYPIHRAAGDGRYAALDRSITPAEWDEARAALEELGFANGFEQELETSNKYYRPDFNDRERPFRDIRHFTDRDAAAGPAALEAADSAAGPTRPLDTEPAAVRH